MEENGSIDGRENILWGLKHPSSEIKKSITKNSEHKLVRSERENKKRDLFPDPVLEKFSFCRTTIFCCDALRNYARSTAIWILASKPSE